MSIYLNHRDTKPYWAGTFLLLQAAGIACLCLRWWAAGGILILAAAAVGIAWFRVTRWPR